MAATNRAYLLEASEVRRMAQGRWREIYSALAPQLSHALDRPGSHVPCPVHNPRAGGDGFRFFPKELGPAGNGGGICNSCKADHSLSDGFKILQWLYGWSFPETLMQVYTALGGVLPDKPGAKPEPPPTPPTPMQTLDPLFDVHQARADWERLRLTEAGAVPLTDPTARPALQYLRSRGLALDELPNDLRLHPRLRYYVKDPKTGAQVCTGIYPALLAVFRDALGRPCTLHRTYLTPQGRKAPVEKSKKCMCVPSFRQMGGGAIRLYPLQGPRMHLAEGIETAMAVRQLLGPAEPVWATTSNTLLQSFEPPEGIEQVVVWADKDRGRAGEAAAQELLARLSQHGIRCRYVTPPIAIPDGGKSVDFLDLVRLYPVEAIRKSSFFTSIKGLLR